MPRSDSATIKEFPPAVLHIRPVILEDVARPAPRSLAEYQRQLALVTIGEEDLAQDSVGENPRFRALVAEWDGQPAGYAVFFGYYSTWAGRGLFLKDLFVLEAFRKRGIGRRRWPTSRVMPSRSTAPEYTGRCSSGVRGPSSSTSSWVRPFAISGGRAVLLTDEALRRLAEQTL
jgi:GNAT superfamily N-acetyltransferase